MVSGKVFESAAKAALCSVVGSLPFNSTVMRRRSRSPVSVFGVGFVTGVGLGSTLTTGGLSPPGVFFPGSASTTKQPEVEAIAASIAVEFKMF